MLRPKRLNCTVEYNTAEEAERALKSAGSYQGKPFPVTYAEQDMAHIRNTEEWGVDPDVQSELEAMGNSTNSKSISSIGARGHHNQQQTNPPPANFNSRASIFSSSSTSTSVSASGSSSLNASQKVMKGAPTNSTPPPPPPPPTIQMDSALRQELEAILRKQANTNEEKYRILDARDKLLRACLIKQTDIKKVEATKGTCPDMCPEKERLMREFQRQV